MLWIDVLFTNVTLYLGTAGLATAMDFARMYRERALAAAELSSQLSQAQLRALQSQLRPHFLFNTLNAVAEQVHVDPGGADRMVMRLSALLRASLHFSERHEIRLREEIATLAHYLDIMEVRHRGRLTVIIDVPDAIEGALVPAMVLQPIVENAISHGAEPSDHPTVVSVHATRAGDSLVLTVCDDGAGLSGPLREGVGLRNTRERLRQLYGAAQRLTVEPRAEGGVRSEIVLPLRC
jgi:LytS/YehU family sensor histidine kinase